jgi:thiol-disulfide isomerase/thioredoxin
MKQFKNKRSLFALMFIVVALACIGFAGVKAIPPKLNPMPSDYDTGITWNRAVKLKKPIVANFYVNYCRYCQKFAPVLERLRKEYNSKYTFVTVDCEKPINSKLASDYGISSYPSLYLVNPKNDNRNYINPSFYNNPAVLRKEFDRFYKNNK